MKFLFDHNLSPRLVQGVADIFSQSLHVSSVGLEKESDLIVWNYAQANAFHIAIQQIRLLADDPRTRRLGAEEE